jgi:hypothetical protein
MQFRVRLGAPGDQAGERLKRDLGRAVQRVFVYLVPEKGPSPQPMLRIGVL